MTIEDVKALIHLATKQKVALEGLAHRNGKGEQCFCPADQPSWTHTNACLDARVALFAAAEAGI